MSTSALARRAREVAIAASAGALALGFAACGSEEAGDADTASAVPATAPIYIEATIRPEGDLKEDTENALSTITGKEDVGAEIEKLLSESNTSDITYQDDIEPWLGSSLSAFVTGVSGTTPDGAVVVQSTDDDAAAEAVEKGEGEEKTYEDVTYWLDGGTARGVTDGYAIFGSERGFRTVVDTLKGDADTIEDSDQFNEAVDAVDGTDDALGLVYFETESLIDTLARSGGIPAEQLEQVREQLVEAGGEAGVAKLGVGDSSISIESAVLGTEEAEAAGDSAAAVAALPGDAWLGIGFGAIGDRGRDALEQLQTLGNTGGQDVDQLLAQVEAQTGLDIEQDLLSWMGDGAFFVQGTGIADIGGALVVQTSDEQATNEAIVKVVELIQQEQPTLRADPVADIPGAQGVVLSEEGVPTKIYMLTAGDKFVVGLGDAAVQEALDPSTTLADSESFKTAKDALGDGIEPTFFFDVAPTLALADGLGASSDPDFAQVRDYLSKFGSIAAGASQDGDVSRGKLVLTLKG